MKMEEGDNREPGDGFEPESDGGWYFDLPSGAWERQEQKNRQLRESVRENIQDDHESPKGDPFRSKSRGLFGMGRKPDEEPAPGRSIAGGKWALNRGGQPGDSPATPASGDDDDGEWSTDAFLPRRADARTIDQIPEQPIMLRRRSPEPADEPASRGMSWDDAFPSDAADDGDEGGSLLDAMRSWSNRDSEPHDEPAPVVEDEDAVESPHAPVLRLHRPSAPDETPEERPIELDEDGEPASRWDQMFGGAPADLGTLDAMKSWASGDLDTGLVAKDETPAEIPPEFLQPFAWETEDPATTSAPIPDDSPVAEAHASLAADEVSIEPVVSAEAVESVTMGASEDAAAAAAHSWAVDDEPSPVASTEDATPDEPVASGEPAANAVVETPDAPAPYVMPGWDAADDPSPFAPADDPGDPVAGSADWGVTSLDDADGPASWADLDAAFAPAASHDEKKPGLIGRLFGRKKKQPEPEPDVAGAMSGAWVPDTDSGDIRVVARGAFGSLGDSTGGWDLPDDGPVTGGWVVDDRDASPSFESTATGGARDESGSAGLGGWTQDVDDAVAEEEIAAASAELVSDAVLEEEAHAGWGTASNTESTTDDSPWSPVEASSAEARADDESDAPVAEVSLEVPDDTTNDTPEALTSGEPSESEPTWSPSFLSSDAPDMATDDAISDTPEALTSGEPSESEPTWSPSFLSSDAPDTAPDDTTNDTPEALSSGEPSESEAATYDTPEALSSDESTESEPTWSPSFLSSDAPDTAPDDAMSDTPAALSSDESSESEPTWSPSFLSSDAPETAPDDVTHDIAEALSSHEPSESEPAWSPSFLSSDAPETAADDAAHDTTDALSSDEPSESEPAWSPSFLSSDAPDMATDDATSDTPEALSSDEPSDSEPTWSPSFLSSDAPETAPDDAISDTPEALSSDEPSESEPTWSPSFLAPDASDTAPDDATYDTTETLSSGEPSESEPAWSPSFLSSDAPETGPDDVTRDTPEALSSDEPSESEPAWSPSFLSSDAPETAPDDAMSDTTEALSSDAPNTAPDDAMSDTPEALSSDEPSESEPAWSPSFLSSDTPDTAPDDATSDIPEALSSDEPSESEPKWSPSFLSSDAPETAPDDAMSDTPEALSSDESSESEPAWSPSFVTGDDTGDDAPTDDPEDAAALPGNVFTLPVRAPEEDDDPWSSFIAARRASGEPFPKGDVPADSNPAGWDNAFPGIHAPLQESSMHNDPQQPAPDDAGAGWGDIYSGLEGEPGDGDRPVQPPLMPLAHGAPGHSDERFEPAEPGGADDRWASVVAASGYDSDPTDDVSRPPSAQDAEVPSASELVDDSFAAMDAPDQFEVGGSDDPWADVAAASGYGGDPSDVAVYRGAGPYAPPPPGDATPEWDAAPAVPPEELAADWTGETRDDDVVLQAFYAHANSDDAETSDEDLPGWGEEPADQALEGILGKEAATLVDEVSDPLDVPFSRMQGWTPQRTPPPEPEIRGWQPDDDEAGDGLFLDGSNSGVEPPDGPIIGFVYDDPDPGREPMRAFAVEPRSRTIVREIVETVLLAILVFLCVRASFQNFKVDGHSMDPTLADGQFLIVNKLVYSKVDLAKLGDYVPFINAGDNPQKHVFHGPERGDIIVLRDPSEPQTDLIKRVIGLPGDTLEISHGVVYINDLRLDEPYITQPWGGDLEKIAIPEDHFFVMGDNRNYSKDSRYPTIGLIREDLIIGKAMFSYWPTSMFGLAPNGHPELAEAKPQLTTERIGD